MVAQGYGITLLPKMVVEHGALPKKIDLHAFKRPIPSRKIGVIWRGSAPQISTIQAVIQKI
jgi:DNA-binding transcriptional LysR family regulator